MFAISRIASKLNAVNNLVRKNLSNNNNNDNNDNTNRWSSDLWSDSTPKSITNKLLKLLDSSGLKGKMQIRKSSRSSSSSSSSSMRRQRAHTIEYNSNNKPSNILDEINSNCLLLKKCLRNRRKIIFMTKKEKTKDEMVNEQVKDVKNKAQEMLQNIFTQNISPTYFATYSRRARPFEN